MLERNYIHEKVELHMLDMINSGQWQSKVPSERLLTKQLKVSRRAVRDAMARLEERGIIENRYNKGRVIKRKPRRRKKRDYSVGFLFRGPLVKQRSTLVYTVQLVQEMLVENGIQVVLYESAQFYAGSKWREKLKHLVQENKHDCWLVNEGHKEVQSLLEEMTVPCVLIGKSHEEISLPYVTIDDRATFHHAINLLLRYGHRKILYSGISKDTPAVKDFDRVVEELRKERAPIVVTELDPPNPESLPKWVRECTRHLKSERGYTAYFVGNPFHYLPLLRAIEQAGRKVPEDFSIVSRYDDQFMNYLVPSPTRYILNYEILAKSYVRQIRHFLSGRTPPQKKLEIVPDLFEGDTLKRLT